METKSSVAQSAAAPSRSADAVSVGSTHEALALKLHLFTEAEVLDAVESTFVIVVLMLSILSVKKFIKSLLLNCEGILRSGDICLFVNLATVLNKTLDCFGDYL